MKQPEYEACKNVLDKLLEERYSKKNTWFLHPVDVDGLPDYKNVVSKPMDLSTVKDNLERRIYKTSDQFLKDVKLIYQNAQKYNRKRHKPVYDAACFMSQRLDEIILTNQDSLGVSCAEAAG
eukprot:CAMPEP_0117883670 /NCGR_PEP_ID=MMETSP0950-20121206/18315_1 /TAXON_ID=44440 /ORGANISM="Chattonella subsalsa, Strain CCMP2191" /LENGTH=121 /DNA_ID=CAMNT_0005739675 /DNA_START=114 /DNA_END=476 /DNA_ORIENTATION=+